MSAKKCQHLNLRSRSYQGFIFLEVLVAMSMILGVWMTSVTAYQRLALNLRQQDRKQAQLRKELDGHEIQENTRANSHSGGRSVNSEPARVSGRNRPMRNIAQPTTQNKR